MSERGKDRRWNRQKRRALILLVTALAGALTVSVLRFAPRINGSLAGEPRIMRQVAVQVAAALAAEQEGQTPVILAGESPQGCRAVPNATRFDENHVFLVITYSEKMHSFCILQYAPPVGPPNGNAITLTADYGQNYGARFPAPIELVPVGHVFKVLPDFLVTMLDWRTKLNRSDGEIAFDSKTDYSSSGPTSNVGLKLNLFEIRAASARKHERINFALDILFAGLFLATMASLALVWRTHMAYRREILAISGNINLATFLREDLDSFWAHGERIYLAKQAELQAQSRAENAAQREQEEVRERLRYWLDQAGGEEHRKEIEACLERGEIVEMKMLCRELAVRPRTPEERLDSLLESLTEYLSDEELQWYRTQAYDVFERAGFRAAREQIVRAHYALRQAAKALAGSEPSEVDNHE